MSYSYSTCKLKLSNYMDTNEESKDDIWHPGTWIRKPLESLYFNNYINLYYHHAIAINDEYIIEVTIDDDNIMKKLNITKAHCVIKKFIKKITNVDVPKNLYNLISEYCLVDLENTGKCCIVKLKNKENWEIYREPKTFNNGIIVVRNALNDVNKPIRYKLTTNNCEVYVNRWWNGKIESHQMRTTIKWCGLTFFGFILTSYACMVSKGQYCKQKAIGAAKAMFGDVANELHKVDGDPAIISRLENAQNNITSNDVDQLQQAESKITESVCFEPNKDIGMDGGFDDWSQGMDSEAVKELCSACKELWKKKKGKMKSFWMKSSKTDIKAFDETKTSSKTAIDAPQTILTETIEANKEKKQFYENPYSQFLKHSGKPLIAAGVCLLIGIGIYKYYTYHNKQRNNNKYELNDDEEDLMAVIEKRLKKLKNGDNTKLITYMIRKINEHLNNDNMS